MFRDVCRKNLLTLTDAYEKATGLSTATVSARFHGSNAFLRKFKAGDCTITVDKLDEMIGAILKAWPQDQRIPALQPVPFWG